MGVPSATSARAPASCGRASGASASSGQRRRRQVVLTTYGRSSGFCVDPIEKKPLNHFLPGSAVLSFGTAGLQPGLPVLPELGHQQVRASSTPWPTRRSPEAIARGGRGAGLPERRLHLQRPGDLHGVRHRLRRRGPRAGRASRRGHRRLYLRPSPGARCSPTWTPPTSTSRASPRRFYQQHLRRQLGAVLETLRVPAPRDRVWLEITTLLIPERERLRRRARRHDLLGGRPPGPGRAHALHRLPPRLQDDGPPRPRRRPSAGPAASPWPTACVTPTPATSTTPRGAAPTARVAVPAWWSVTGSRSVSTASRATATARTAAPAAPASTTGQQGPGAPAAVPCASPRPWGGTDALR